MKVKLKKRVKIPKEQAEEFGLRPRVHKEGEVIDVPDYVADNMFSRDVAEEPSKVDVYREIYDWGNKVTSEQAGRADWEYIAPFYWTDQAEDLLMELELGGALVAVIGPQGSGKTELRKQIFTELKDGEEDESVMTCEWTGKDSIFDLYESTGKAAFRDMTLPTDLLRSIARMLKPEHISGGYQRQSIPDHKFSKAIGGTENAHVFCRILDEREKDRDRWKAQDLLPKIEKIVGKRRLREKIREWVTFKIRRADTILIDFTDFDRSQKSRMNRHLQSFRKFWESELISYEQKPNVVVFFQKELWGGHYYDGKFETREMDMPEPHEMADFVLETFDEVPFTRDALIRLAELALLGKKWRDFKIYVKKCLKTFFRSDVEQIGSEEAEEWVSDLAKRRLDLKLRDLFPKGDARRNMARKAISHIRSEGEVRQKDLAEIFFSSKGRQARS